MYLPLSITGEGVAVTYVLSELGLDDTTTIR